MKIRFSGKYFCIFLLFFVVEVWIALFGGKSFLRTFGGDVLVVILVYFFFVSFFESEEKKTILGVLLFAFLVELGQYFNLVSILGLEDVKIARIVIGTTFDFKDLLAYSVGAFLLFCLYLFKKKRVGDFNSEQKVNISYD